jgi:hypothetical protein
MKFFLLIALFGLATTSCVKTLAFKEVVKNIIEKEPNMEFYYTGMFENGHAIYRRAPLVKEQVLLAPYKKGILKYEEYKNAFVKLENIRVKQIKPDKMAGIDFLLLLFKKEKEILYTIEIADSIVGINGLRYEFSSNYVEVRTIVLEMVPEICIEVLE